MVTTFEVRMAVAIEYWPISSSDQHPVKEPAAARRHVGEMNPFHFYDMSDTDRY